MTTTRHRANGTKAALRLRLSPHARRAMLAKRTGRPLIPTGVLQALAALSLPRNKRLYTKHLNALLRDA